MTVEVPTRPVVGWRGSVVLGVVLGVLYGACSTWSVGAGSGPGSEGGWTDPTGAPVGPVRVLVTSHPMPWVPVVLAAVLVAGVLAARRAPTADAARARLAASAATSAVLVLAVLLVCSGLQAWLVDGAIAAHRVPAVFGGAVLEVARTPPG